MDTMYILVSIFGIILSTLTTFTTFYLSRVSKELNKLSEKQAKLENEQGRHEERLKTLEKKTNKN